MPFTKDECNKWYDNRLINPKTKRNIRFDGATYNKLRTSCKLYKIDCKEWLRNRHINPVTKRRINIRAKNGVFKQLLTICAEHDSSPQFEKTPSEQQKQNLINVVKKYIKPILNRSNSLDTRITYTKILKNHLKTFTKNTCIQKHKGKLVLINDKDKLLTFEKRIGSDSENGVAYINTGSGMSKLLKFSTKLMSSSSSYHKQEVKLLKKMSQLAEKRKCPNMPIIYDVIECKTPCPFSECPELTKNEPYYIVLSELANYDMFEFLKKKRTTHELQSVFLQMILSIYAFQNLGYKHDDTHFGNFLIHETENKSGYWEYNVNGNKVYVPNAGYTVVMWDPGQAEVINVEDNTYVRDYEILTYFMTLANEKGFIDKFNTKKLPDDFIVEIKELYEYILNEYANIDSKLKKEQFMNNIISMFKKGDVDFPGVYINKKPTTKIINEKPYVL